MRYKKWFKFIALILATTATALSAAEDELWDQEWEEEATSWSGFVEYGYGTRFSNDPLFSKDETLNELRLYLQNEWQLGKAEFNIKAETWYDGVLNKWKLDARELSISFSAFGNTDFRIGRQVSTWGTGDLLFLNDQFPKGWNDYFNGRDDNYVKAPANAVRITSFFDLLNVDLVWAPEFTADYYINGDRFSFYSPLIDQNVGGSDVINEQEPSGAEYALRLYKNIDGIEYALYGYKGFDKRPLGLTANLQPTFHKRNLLGASIRGALGSGIFNLEAVHENALDDPQGTNPLINNALSKLLIGYESEWLPKVTVGFQYYLERLDDYAELINNSPFPQLETKRNREWLTNRIRYVALQDKLTLNLFSFYSLTDKDYFLRWNINYRQDDHWNYTFGINQIDGEQENTFFAQFKKASNAYFRIRYNF
ncbi:MAG: hypothetical protein HWE16_19025 [Gammaproteobacteria bacterium]|nr:hypothetical protein [Gammaproteobacteria bacterium]